MVKESYYCSCGLTVHTSAQGKEPLPDDNFTRLTRQRHEGFGHVPVTAREAAAIHRKSHKAEMKE